MNRSLILKPILPKEKLPNSTSRGSIVNSNFLAYPELSESSISEKRFLSQELPDNSAARFIPFNRFALTVNEPTCFNSGSGKNIIGR